LYSSEFSDSDTGDTHQASQWQISTTAGNYSNPVYDSGADTIHKTSITVSAGVLSNSTTYYWRVRHQDSNNAWSNYSNETSFITIEPNKANFTFSPESPKEGEEMQFTDQSTPQTGIVSWSWDFGEGGTNAAQNPKYTYLQANNPSQTFSVALTVKWNDGNSDTKTKSVEIYDEDPVAKFHWEPLDPEVGQEITFFDASESYDGIISWNWTFGEGDSPVQAFEFQLSYDADVLEFKEAQLNSEMMALGPKLDKSKGKILYGGICLSDKQTDASGTIARLEFMPRQVGELQLDISYLKLVDSQWRLVPTEIEKQIPQRIMPQAPQASALLPNYPNPFNPETWIPYQLNKEADVNISIYNMKGQLVRQINLGYKPTGYYLDKSEAAHWDGKNNVGEKVASGLYFYQLQSGDFRAIRRMMLFK